MSSKNSLYRYIFHGTRLNLAPEHLQSLSSVNLEKPSAWPTFNQGEVLSKGTTTCLKVSLPSNQGTIYFKRYSYKKNRWEFFLRRSKAANESINYLRFKKIGIPTLDTIALYEQRSLGRLDIACIITTEQPNTMRLDHFFTKVLLEMPKNERLLILKSLKDQLFEQLKTAHKTGMFHLDLKWRNILIQQCGDTYSPIWIDCPRGIQRKLFNYRLKVADLSGLARKALSFFTTQQLYRMIYCYLGPSTSKAEARKLFFDISKHLNRRPPKKLTP